VTKLVKDVFEALEKISEPTLHLVAPSYYLLHGTLQPVRGECVSVALFRSKLCKYLVIDKSASLDGFLLGPHIQEHAVPSAYESRGGKIQAQSAERSLRLATDGDDHSTADRVSQGVFKRQR